jgi:fatty-acyl-CoA synthase
MQSDQMAAETVGDLLDGAAAAWPDALALLTPDGKRWTFEQLRVEACQVAAALLERLEPGERVAVWAPTGWPWYLTQLAAAVAGVTLVTVNPAYQSAELQDVLGRSGSAAIVVADEVRGRRLPKVLAQVRGTLPRLREVIVLSEWEAFRAGGDPSRSLPHVDPGDPAQIQYTSGTTGTPKGAVLPHRAITTNGRAGAVRWGVNRGEVWLNAMPMCHVAGSVINSLGALAAGATQLICPFDPSVVVEAIAAHRVGVACLAGTMWSMVLEHAGDADLSCLRLAVAGGQSIPAELVQRLEARTGARMSILYGMTELCGTITAVAPDDDETRLYTCGRPLPGVEVRVVAPGTPTPLPADSVGEIQARGWLTMTGYDQDAAATATTLLPDGWLRTGDLGTIDAEGRLRVSGRVKEMIIRGAENIYPAEIENRLRAHPAVQDAAVVGLPDPVYGELVAAALVIADGAFMPAADELKAFCRETLAAFKTPVRWLALPALPMTASGKIQKFRVRQEFGCHPLDRSSAY